MIARHVNQFHSGTAFGDAITNEMIAWRSHLRSLGYLSEIYAQHIPALLADSILDISGYDPPAGSILLLHHSMGHDILESVLAHPHHVVPVYHNITPTEFIDQPYVRRYARLGHQMLFALAEHATAAIADSNFNRQEMLRAGFRSVRVIPVRTEFSDVRVAAPIDGRSQNWLFVGRMVPSKNQTVLVEAFADSLAAHDTGGQLVLVGDTSDSDYVTEVERRASLRGIGDRIRVTGKVSDVQLAEEYARAGLFTSASSHEGFGVPLLEAMAAGLPVVAFDSGAIAETMGGAGFVVPIGASSIFVSTCIGLLTDQDLRERVVDGQRKRLATLEAFDVRAALQATIAEASGHRRRLQLQIQGPFETSYSLAIVNRELALALDAEGTFDVSIYATEGPGDYSPRPEDLDHHPRAAELHRRSQYAPTPDVVIRQMFPPRVKDSPGALTFQYFGWEESRLPPEHVADFNQYLDGIGAMSHYVKSVLQDSGVHVPIDVVGIPVRKPDLARSITAPELAEMRSFRFLHLSSAFPRKGVDLLLDAYFDRFTGSDDVTLILKTFPNAHNTVAELLRDRRVVHVDPPHVIWIDRDMDVPEIDGLFVAATVMVSPSRGEGFGLPVAEAMRARVPVIAPASTGLADFVGPDTATVVSHRAVPAQTHISVPGSMWEEPDVVGLGDAMLWHVEHSDAAVIAERVDAAEQLVSERYSWPTIVDRWSTLIDRVRERRTAPHIAMVSTFNTRCGIAEYTAALVRSAGPAWQVEIHANHVGEIIDERVDETVTRDWISSPSASIDELLANLERSSAEIIHVQHNFGFIGLRQLGELIRRLGGFRPLVVTLHRTEDLESADLSVRLADVAADLARVDRIVVHQHEDARRLHALGVERVTVIPIGTESVRMHDIDAARAALELDVPLSASIVATYGFLLPHKGTLELIQAIGLLRDQGHDVGLLAVCALHPDPASSEYARACSAEIERLGLGDSVSLVTEFLRPEVSRLLLSAADVIALPYHETSESSSASLRSVLPIGRAVLTTDIEIFADARSSIVLVGSSPRPESIAAALFDLLVVDPDQRDRYGRLAVELARASSLEHSVRRHTDLYHDLLGRAVSDD